MFTTAKDALTSRAAQNWANNLLTRYGKVLDLKIDSARRTMEVSCQLDGEATLITVRLDYVVEVEAGKKFMRGSNFSSTRRWLQNFLNDHGPGKRLELPAWAAAAL